MVISVSKCLYFLICYLSNKFCYFLDAPCAVVEGFFLPNPDEEKNIFIYYCEALKVGRFENNIFWNFLIDNASAEYLKADFRIGLSKIFIQSTNS